MIKRVVISAPARGYVDGRFIGEEKEPRDGAAGGRGRRGKSNANADSILGSVPGIGKGRGAGKGTGTGRTGGRGKPRGAQGGATGGAGVADNIGNTTAKRRGRTGQPRGVGHTGGGVEGGSVGQAPRGRRPGAGSQTGPRQGGQGQGKARGQGRPRADGNGNGSGNGNGNGQGASLLGGGINATGRGGRGGGAGGGRTGSGMPGALGADGRPPMRKSRGAKKTPFRSSPNQQQPLMSPTQGSDIRRFGDESKSGQFAEALAASANVKRERLHKVLAQSGHGSRRDMEILISSGRLMVNGIVATAGTQVAPGDNVLLDLRPIKLKFSEDLPRVLLYHKPEGEIVTTNDPGNRITVFDNLPRVENGKWVSVGRLDINTSGLLIFTTSGELANRFMHPRYEVEREYAVRILGELTEDQGKRLLEGIVIDSDDAKRMDHDEPPEDYEEFERDDHEDHVAHALVQAEHAENAHDEHDGLDDHDQPPADFGRGNSNGNSNSDGNNNGNVAQPAQPIKPVQIDAQRFAAKPSAPIRDGLARFDSIEKRGGEGVNQWYHVVIKEGRNREVRKMFEALGLTVSRLIRIRFGKIELPPRLARGKMMELEPAQVKSVLASAGMVIEGAAAPLPAGAGAGARQDRNNSRRSGRDGKPGPEGQAQGQGQRQGQRTRPAREPRDPKPARNPRTPPRGSQVPRDFVAGGDTPAASQTAQWDENGAPILASPDGVEGAAHLIGQPGEPRDAQPREARDGQRNKRRSRGGRGTRGGRDVRTGERDGGPQDISGNDAVGHADADNQNRSLAPRIAQDFSGADDNMGNSVQPLQATDAASLGAARQPHAGRGRSRRNLRGRTSRGPRIEHATPVPEPKENNGNE